MADVQVETPKDLTNSDGAAALVDIWTKEIENSSNKERNFRDEARKYFQIYEDSKDLTDPSTGEKARRYNVFWSNTQTLRPLVFSRLPKPNITRRFLDKDENSRILSEMMERAITFFLEEGKAEDEFNEARDDFLIGGRGVVRVIFDPPEVIEIEKKTVDEDTGDELIEIEEDLDLDTKKTRLEYVEWENIRLSTETTWNRLRWMAISHKMTKDQLVDQFGKIGKEVDLNHSSLSNPEDEDKNDNELFKLAEVWEIWDKTSKRVLFITTGLNGKILSDEDDPYKLKEFFPIPKILGSDSNPSNLTPIPLYRMYKSQAEELNDVDARIKSLIQQVRFTGVYSSIAEDSDIDDIMNGIDGQFGPMKGVQPGQNIRDLIFTKPIEMITIVIRELDVQKSNILQNIRDITGLSDIVRGTTIASETATAQRLKGDFAISRIQPLQREVENFARDAVALQTELIVENYTVAELAKITNLQIVDINTIARVAQEKQDALMQEALVDINQDTPEGQQQIEQLEAQREAGFKATMEKPLNDLKGYAVTPEQLTQIDALMKDDKLRTFAVDIETDSTVRVDQNQEKADRIEYVQAISTFFAQVTPVLQIGGLNKAAFNEMLSFISKPFKVGRNLEEYILAEEEVNPEPEEPSVEEQLAQADSQRKDQKLQLDAQEVDIKQQLANVEKAKVKVGQMQFDENLEFEDVNKEADRKATTLGQVIQDSTQRATSAIRESNLLKTNQ